MCLVSDMWGGIFFVSAWKCGSSLGKPRITTNYNTILVMNCCYSFKCDSSTSGHYWQKKRYLQKKKGKKENCPKSSLAMPNVPSKMRFDPHPPFPSNASYYHCTPHSNSPRQKKVYSKDAPIYGTHGSQSHLGWDTPRPCLSPLGHRGKCLVWRRCRWWARSTRQHEQGMMIPLHMRHLWKTASVAQKTLG